MEFISREDYCEETCGKENREGYKDCWHCEHFLFPIGCMYGEDNDGIKTPKRDNPLYAMDEICKMNGVEFKGGELNEK